MEDKNRVSKRKKGADNYHKSKYSRPGASIEAGDAGVLVTCDLGKEGKCIAEILDLLSELHESSQDSKGTSAATESDDDEDGDDDIEAQIQKEVEGLKPKSPARRLFQAIRLDIPCLTFIRMDKSLDPVKMAHDLCTAARANPGQKKGRWVKRVIPLTQVRKILRYDLHEFATDILKPHFHAGSGPKKYAIRPTIRNCHQLNRDIIIQTVAAAVGPEHKVDLKNYDHVILVEVAQNVIGMSVVGSDYDSLKRFNLAEIYRPSSNMQSNQHSKSQQEHTTPNA
ncbi:THUMP domain protein [Talaromyces proteolyticus]|uniref:THUMP domain protein n=1 Tax=Talaromyces proteolyticus TaxID=1131652 RepID=A0AAD4PUW2_9EURO|nr:THUMP domain protein [Talaromyces proteolyticus]KAH8692684.1 THUMP domain protein [Talaromyces proteolyticus]